MDLEFDRHESVPSTPFASRQAGKRSTFEIKMYLASADPREIEIARARARRTRLSRRAEFILGVPCKSAPINIRGEEHRWHIPRARFFFSSFFPFFLLFARVSLAPILRTYLFAGPREK